MKTYYLLLLCSLSFASGQVSGQAMLHPKNFDLSIGLGATLPIHYYRGRSANAGLFAKPKYGGVIRLDLAYHGKSKIGLNFPIRLYYENVSFEGFRGAATLPFYQRTFDTPNVVGTRRGNYHIDAIVRDYGIGLRWRKSTTSLFCFNILASKRIGGQDRYKYRQLTSRILNVFTGEYDELTEPIESIGEQTFDASKFADPMLEFTWDKSFTPKSSFSVSTALEIIVESRYKQHRISIAYLYKIF